QLLGDDLDDKRFHLARLACARLALPACRVRGHPRLGHDASLRQRAGSIGTPSASRDATYACATWRDSARMRAMYAARSVTEIAPRASSTLNACAALRIISYPGSGSAASRRRFASLS